jgi:hypothetical protein
MNDNKKYFSLTISGEKHWFINNKNGYIWFAIIECINGAKMEWPNE